MRLQQKLLNRMATPSLVAKIIDKTARSFIKDFKTVIKITKSKPIAKKAVENVIKTSIEIGLLDAHNELSGDDLHFVPELKTKFENLASTLTLMHDRELAFDAIQLIDLVVFLL